jgi:hypothetical protein
VLLAGKGRPKKAGRLARGEGGEGKRHAKYFPRRRLIRGESAERNFRLLEGYVYIYDKAMALHERAMPLKTC